jgi:hypothetical protein
MASITTATPRVGSIAWWKAGVKPAGSAGHVAYVEQVVSANEIILSQDSWNGDFSWTRIVKTGGGWPSGFVHFRDVALLNTRAPTVTGTSKVGSVLTATAGTWSQAGAVFSYQWMQDGAPITGATATTFTPTLAQQGKAITVRVTAVKLGFPNTPATSAATTAVLPGVLTNTARPTIAGEPQVGETLSASTGTWNPAAQSLAYQWQADGVAIPGATSRTLVLGPDRAGQAISVAVTAAKTGYAAVTTTSTPSAAVAPGTLTLPAAPTVAGTTQPGHVLTLVLPQAPPQSRVAVQWMRNAVPVAGATGRSYTLTAADAGARVLAQVTVTRPGYRTLTTRTSWSAVVRATPVITVTTQRLKRRVAFAATVTATGVRPVTGLLQVRSRGKLLKQVTLTNGVARATLTRLPRGTRVYRFRYVTSTKVTGGRVDRRITIR